jgi:hypothetical protein
LAEQHQPDGQGDRRHDARGFRLCRLHRAAKIRAHRRSENLDLHGEELAWRASRRRRRAALSPSTPGAYSVAVAALFRRADGIEYTALAGGSIGTAGTLNVEVVAVTDGAPRRDGRHAARHGFGLHRRQHRHRRRRGAAAFVAGVDIEDDESFRARILFRKRNPPHGGSAGRLCDVGRQVAGVSFYLDRPTVFVERLWRGPGTVRVFPLMFDLYANGIPQAGRSRARADISRRCAPAGADVTVRRRSRCPPMW